MQTTISHAAFAQARRQTWIARGAGLAVLIAAGVIFWLAATYHTTVVKKEAPVSMLMPVEAPPPPPPPPKEIKQQESETAPVEQPITPPQQQTTHDNALTQNADAQAGSDAFGIGSGSGEGMRGSGVAGMAERGPYASYMAQVIRQAANRNALLRGKMFQVGVKLWLTPAGKISRAELSSSTGSDAFDRELKSMLLSLTFDQAPPQSILDSLPVEMAVKVRPG